MNDLEYMRLAITEASHALGRTHPNPAVGAVIVKAGRIIAKGFHARAGTPHAEAIALKLAGDRAKGATLYSTLEPCNHQGRTPPCTEAIIAAGIRRVVYGSPDPNPLVNGKGRQRLEAAGLEVVGDVARAETDALNPAFFKFITTRMPYVTAKAGVTLDGKLAARSGKSKWITSPEARDAAHRLRDRVDGVVVGVGTVLADNPSLTTRIPGGRTAVRVVVDSHLRAPPKAQVFDTQQGRTIVATLESTEAPKARRLLQRGVEVWTVAGRRGRVALRPLLARLAAEGLLHLLVEGGAELHGALFKEHLVDEVALFVAPKVLGGDGLSWVGALGLKGPDQAVQLGALTVGRAGPDLLLRAPVIAPATSTRESAKRR